MKPSRLAVPAVFVITLVLAAAPQASAQSAGFGVGYQFLRLTSFELNYPVGVNVDGAIPVGGPLSVIGELGWSRHNDEDIFKSTVITLGAGVRASGSGTTAGYGQVVIGYQRDNDEFVGVPLDSNSLYAGIDGGVQAGVVFAQVGYRRIAYEGEGANGFRFLVGFRAR